jgi:hypothetical protein
MLGSPEFRGVRSAAPGGIASHGRAAVAARRRVSNAQNATPGPPFAASVKMRRQRG